MLEYQNNTYNNSYWQQHTLEKKFRKNKSAEKMAEFHCLAKGDHVRIMKMLFTHQLICLHIS